MDKNRIYLLESMPIRKAIYKLALPTVFSMIVQIFYNITDTFFVGKLNDPYQLAAVSIAMPIFMMQMAISGIFGNGAASYLSRQLGRKDYSGARETATISIFSCLVTSFAVAVIGIYYMPQILSMAGASPHTIGYASAYLKIIFLGSAIMMLGFTISQLLRAEGAAKAVMIGNLIGTGVNIVLDPLFIFVFHQGVAGAAIATVIGSGCSLLYFLSFYWRKKSHAMPSWQYLKFRWETYKEIFKIGVPSSISQVMMSVGNAISYSVASGYGDASVAALGIVWRVMTIPIFIIIGIAISIQPLVGYNYGANNPQRLKSTVKTALGISGALAAFFTLCFFLFPRAFILVFIADPQVVEIGEMVLRAFTFAIPFAAIQMPLMTSLQAMGKGIPSLIIALSRNGLVYIPAVYLLNYLFGFEGLVYALPLSDMITAVMSFFFILNIVQKLKYHKVEIEPQEVLVKEAIY